MGSLQLNVDLEAYFRGVIDEASSHANTSPKAHIREYVVGLLQDAAQDTGVVTATVDRPLALLLNDALHAAPSERFHKLRSAGDGILLVGGLYRTHLKRSGLKDGYVVTLGQRAYESASLLLDAPSGALTVGTDRSFDILHDLACAFFDVMRFLRAVADTMAARAAHSAGQLARLYELWLADRSPHLERLLRAQGLIISPRALAPS